MDRRSPKFDPNYFLVNKTVQKGQEQLDPKTGRTDERRFMQYPMMDNPTAYHSVVRINDDVLKKLLTTKAPVFDEMFGSGASSWVTNNLHQFSPEERLKLLYTFENSRDKGLQDVNASKSPNSYTNYDYKNPNVKPEGVRG